MCVLLKQKELILETYKLAPESNVCMKNMFELSEVTVGFYNDNNNKIKIPCMNSETIGIITSICKTEDDIFKEVFKPIRTVFVLKQTEKR